MKTYRISSVTGGADLGEYQGETELDAIRAMTRDAGYGSLEAAAKVCGGDVDDYLADLSAVEVTTDTSCPTGCPEYAWREADARERRAIEEVYGAGKLDSLLDALRERGDRLPEACWTELPTFGGVEPADTHDVWSWDATRLLVSTNGSENYAIVLRADRYGVSIDNDQHVVDPDSLSDEQVESHYDALVNAMDDQAREEAHSEAAPCTKRAFLAAYLQFAGDDLVIG